MKYIEYEDKTNKNEKGRAVDVMSVLDTMAELEEYYGATQEKLIDNWYELKRQLRNILTVQIEKKQ